jgi:hypothetical protein
MSMLTYRHRDTGRLVNVPPGSVAAARMQRKPRHWQLLPTPQTGGSGAAEQVPSQPVAPPLTGRGSGIEAWRAFAAAATGTPAEQWASMPRADIVAKLAADGVIGDAPAPAAGAGTGVDAAGGGGGGDDADA